MVISLKPILRLENDSCRNLMVKIYLSESVFIRMQIQYKKNSFLEEEKIPKRNLQRKTESRFSVFIMRTNLVKTRRRKGGKMKCIL